MELVNEAQDVLTNLIENECSLMIHVTELDMLRFRMERNILQ